MKHKGLPSKTVNRDSVILLGIIFGDEASRAKARSHYLNFDKLGEAEGDERISKIAQLATRLGKGEVAEEMNKLLGERQKGRAKDVAALRDSAPGTPAVPMAAPQAI